MSFSYDEIKELIAQHSDVAEFADFGNGVSEDWIKKAEAALGFPLPCSYRWWLTNYSGGEVGGEEIFSVYEEDFDTVVGGDIVYMHRLNQRNKLVTEDQLSICESDIDGIFAFDLSKKIREGEYPVLSLITGTVYADNFIEFLEKRIQAFC